MGLKKCFLILFLGASCFVWGDSLIAPKQQLQTIQKEMDELTRERDRHFRKAAYYQKEGDRWRYSHNDIEQAYESWGKADDERRQAHILQHKIEDLQEQKERLYQKYPKLRY